jgi:rhodanese-related sulfurtransferase
MSLSIDQFIQIINEESSLIIDTRPAIDWIDGHIPRSLHITPATVKFAVAMGLINKDSSIALVIDEQFKRETLAYFKEANFSNVLGYLQGGFDQWKVSGQKIDLVIEVEADELAMDIPYDEYLMPLDIRAEELFDNGHIKNSVSIPLVEFMDPGSFSELDEHFNIYIISEDGLSNTLAASILKKEGIHNFRMVQGGWESVMLIKEKFTIESNKKKISEE